MSHREHVVAAIAKNKGFEGYLPLSQSRRRWSDRSKFVALPLFPGYVFCRLNPQNRLFLLTTPGALHLVGVGKTPIPIEDSEIAAIQAAVQSGLMTEPWPFLEAGQKVRIEEGPLAGLEGILVRTEKQQRLIVSVSLLKQSVAVLIERRWATPLDGIGRPLGTAADPAGIYEAVRR
jgi:transcription antitermination factor NusG